MTAWLFPGQGTDLATLPRAALDEDGPVRRLLDHATQVVGIDVVAALRAGDPVVCRTEVAQPALVAVTLGLARARAAAGERVDAVAGHSLGELAAVAFAGCCSAEDAIAAAATRGRLMAEAARAAPGGMVAVRCPDAEHLRALLEHGRRFGSLFLAAHNSPTQWVLSGDRAALGAVLGRAPGAMLPVAGPWHSSAMTSAAVAWEPSLRAIPWSPPRRRLVLAGTATFVSAVTDVRAALLRQLTEPVLWTATVETLLDAGISRLSALGPGRVLKGLCREILDGRAASSPEVRVA